MKKKYCPTVNSKQNFPEIEKKNAKFWEEEQIFEASLDKNKNNPAYVFYDGPPFANGLPHYGHLLTGYVKDLIPRYQTMKGKFVQRKFGWDCHGLPAEMDA
jgi:isoleucyl-tRNA synthetase